MHLNLCMKNSKGYTIKVLNKSNLTRFLIFVAWTGSADNEPGSGTERDMYLELDLKLRKLKLTESSATTTVCSEYYYDWHRHTFELFASMTRIYRSSANKHFIFILCGIGSNYAWFNTNIVRSCSQFRTGIRVFESIPQTGRLCRIFTIEREIRNQAN